MFIKRLFSETPLSLSIVYAGDEAARDNNKLDYLPFGVKTLKVELKGDYKGKLRVAPARFSSVAGEKFAHEDGDGPPQFVISWGGGHEDYFELDYPKKRIVYFLVQHVGQACDDRVLTILVRGAAGNDILAQLSVNLTYPTFGGMPWPSEELVRPRWQEVSAGDAGESDILLSGQYVPDYISRWWPVNRVVYDAYGAPPPQIRVRYRRRSAGDYGDLIVYAAASPGAEEKILAKVEGSILYPLYDMQQILPELYRFGPKTWALRIWFFWLDKEISLDDLKRYGTRTASEIHAAWQALQSKAEAGLADKSWPEIHEIPDAERVDIVFNKELQPLFAATDLHWRELWGRFEQLDPPVVVRIMNTRLVKLIAEWDELGKVLELWFNVVRSQVPGMAKSSPYNPQIEVVKELDGLSILAANPIANESHTPAFMNCIMRTRFTSTDVTDG